MPGRRYDDRFLDDTLAVFQPRTARRLTREDARQIVENVTGFFRVLLEWDAADRAAASAASHSPAVPIPDASTVITNTLAGGLPAPVAEEVLA